MSTFVHGDGLPLILEYPEDDLETVTEQWRRHADAGDVVVFNARGGGQDVGVKIMVNFGLIPVLVVGPHDPDADENGQREDDARILVTTYLDNRAV